MKRYLFAAILIAVPSILFSQDIFQARGVDQRVNYLNLGKYAPWDDRNYNLTEEDLKALPKNEARLKDPIPVFYRVIIRQDNRKLYANPETLYPRSALNVYLHRYLGYLIDGKIYKEVTVNDEGGFEVILTDPQSPRAFASRFLSGEVLVSPGEAESTIEINHTNSNLVIAGTNGFPQKMFFSSNGGDTFSPSAALPGGGAICCDPTIDYSSDGSLAYTASLVDCPGTGCDIRFWRSDDNGASWNSLSGAGSVRIVDANCCDKEFIHVDKYLGSPFTDNIYLTWHAGNTMRFGVSTDSGNSWSTQSFGAEPRGIGSDITTDQNGDIYYIYPAHNSEDIRLLKSTNGGSSFAASTVIASTNDGFDFAIPAMETRRAFIYVAADTDYSNGPFANTIYAAWTDTLAPENGTPSNNHARIQVARSTNGGASWSVTTPHPTADQLSVDRFHPWLDVANDGKVYVGFYDTQNFASRTGVDFYYSVSEDGGVSFSAPTRISGTSSPNIGDGFEWGDYNGLSVSDDGLLTIFTDNRNELGGGADSVDVYVSGETLTGPGLLAPTASFTFVCNLLQCTFDASGSSDSDGVISDYSWDFDDASGGSGSNLVHNYAVGGSYNVALTVTDNDGLTDTNIQLVSVNLASSCPAGSIDFSSFAMEGYSNQDNPAQGGSITVEDGGDTLRMIGNRWRRSTQTYNLTANTVVEFDYASGSEGEIHALGFDENQTLTDTLRVFEFFGTQNWSGDITFAPQYSGSGAFESFQIPVGASYTGNNFRLVLVNDKDAGTKNNEGLFRCVRVFENTPAPVAPVASFTSSCTGLSCSFDATASSDSDGSIVDYSWTFGDASNGSGVTPNHVYASANTYTVDLTVTDDDGLTDTSSQFVTVSAAPSCSVTIDFESGAAGFSNSASATCSTGDFVVATPTLQTNSGVTTQVGGDSTTGSGSALFTATNVSAGNADVDNGVCITESPVWAVGQQSTLSAQYFHGQRDSGDDPGGDFFRLELSLDGGASFSSIVNIGDVQTEAAWTPVNANIPAGSQVQLRLRVADGAGPGDLVEGGIDDISICN